MVSLFGWILVLHILAAIAVIGPALVVLFIRRTARTADQFRFAFDVTNKLAILPKIGGAVLIMTGVWLMIISKMGLSQMWLNLSILLSLLMVATIEGLIGPWVVLDMSKNNVNIYKNLLYKKFPWESVGIFR
ncbi:DUF2269 family protein [Paenibacillus dokdonensis]|uniref:DUF2269 family protein n=1 Tax=Paenibacillus dokdonensis TaxID=2567944 RepID=A0ABU6GJX5_9BACL|nr:DUF2269 family protein [Paenibacillus dokdonensis]MEC0240039.1 DUF2269 family protein [Paenibacillus dokdonensis]